MKRKTDDSEKIVSIDIGPHLPAAREAADCWFEMFGLRLSPEKIAQNMAEIEKWQGYKLQVRPRQNLAEAFLRKDGL